MRRPIIDWDECDFLTEVNGMTFRITTMRDWVFYRATAFIPGYKTEDKFCNIYLSEISTEDAILKLVKLLEE